MSRKTSGTRPRISVLLPVHQAEDTLPVCLRSLRRQRETDWECIAVDDGSTDGSGRILHAAAREDPRVRVVSIAHAGLVPALAAGLAACRAPVVARMDADDWMHRDRLAEQLAALDADPTLSGVGTRVRLFPRAGPGAGPLTAEFNPRRDGRRHYEAWLNGLGDPESVARDAFVECPIAHPTLAIRTDVLRRFGYRDRGWPEDYDLVLRLLAGGHRLGVVPRRLHGWRDTPHRLSRTDPAYGLDRFTACKAAHLAAGFLAASPSYVLWGYGSTGRALRRALLDHGRRPSHVVELHPGRLGQRIHGAPVIPPEALTGPRPGPIVVSVAGARARGMIRAALDGMHFREGTDYVCAA